MTTSPRNVLPFKGRRSYQDAVRERDCQGERRAVPLSSPLMEGMERVKAWLDAGVDPREIRAKESARCRGVINEEIAILKQCETPTAAAAFLMDLANDLLAESDPCLK